MKRALLIVVALFGSASMLAAEDDAFKRERKPTTAAAKDALEGKAPPALTVENWLNTDGKILTLKQLEGKVVLIDFWGVWCGPCRRAIPHLKELAEKHKDAGLVVIGIHTTNQGEKMANFVEEQEIRYPVAVDIDKKTVQAFKVDSYPDYYLIDRKGQLRFADLANSEVDRAVKMLLEEE